MYIMCVCLFSALSRRVGALQISVIIIIKYKRGIQQSIHHLVALTRIRTQEVNAGSLVMCSKLMITELPVS